MIKHIVFWKINENGSDEDRRETCRIFREKTEYLKTVIPQIRQAQVALNYNAGAPEAFHICIDSVFDSDEDLQRYINHPEHLKVRAFMDSVSYAKTVFDYTF
ncbi:MAG: Dabb family protein [Enterocloster asparagiformis]|nr:Dabb family protein [Enterocloster asparagiformis]